MRREHYEQDAQFADHHWWWAARRKILRRVMGKYIKAGSGKELLEVGCSTGSNLQFLSEFGTVSALEIDEVAAKICRSRYPETVLYNQPIPERLNKRFDVICAFDVIEHIEDEPSTIAWICEHLEDGGMAIVTVPAFDFLWSQYDEDAHHFRRYSSERLTSVLKARFDLEYVTFFNTHLFPIIALVRILQRLGLVRLDGRDKEIGSQGIMNSLLYSAFVSELAWIPRLRLPFGVSLLAVARKI